MVLFWLTSIVLPLVLTWRKGHLAWSSCAGAGQVQGEQPHGDGHRCARGAPLPRDRRARTPAWGLHQVASPSQQPDLYGVISVQRSMPCAPVTRVGMRRHPQLPQVTLPPLPLGPAADPLLWFNHTFPLFLFPYCVGEAALHGATVTKLPSRS